MCDLISKNFQMEYPVGLLFRRASVLPSHVYPWERPSVAAHFESLGCAKADLGGADVLLFDDVRTTGNTSQACKRRLQADAKCGDVVRLFLARVEA